MKCQIMLSGTNKKNITNWSSAEFAMRVVKVKGVNLVISFLLKKTTKKKQTNKQKKANK